jgi:DNA polymerase (family 10)
VAAPAGDFRRGCELVSDLALVAEAPSPEQAGKTLSRGGGLRIHLTGSAQFGIVLLHATGSQTHIETLQSVAHERNMVLDETGLLRGRKVVARKSEQEIYSALGLPFIAPELREGTDEIALAQEGKLPRLVTDSDIRGVLHAHTNLSDGVDSLEVMAEATRGRGYQYFGVADHSKSAHYAGGLSIEEIEQQHDEIDRLNQRYGPSFQILKGIESDILPDGSLDYPEDVLMRFDFVVASVHGRFKLSRNEQTERILRAVANPYTTILGHMTGRQLSRRPGYELDVETPTASDRRTSCASYSRSPR